MCINITIYTILYILKIFFNFVNIRRRISYPLIREILVGRTIETSQIKLRIITPHYSHRIHLHSSDKCLHVCTRHPPLLNFKNDLMKFHPSYRSLHIPIKIDRRSDQGNTPLARIDISRERRSWRFDSFNFPISRPMAIIILNKGTVWRTAFEIYFGRCKIR